jgi:hypothetical protein
MESRCDVLVLQVVDSSLLAAVSTSAASVRNGLVYLSNA